MRHFRLLSCGLIFAASLACASAGAAEGVVSTESLLDDMTNIERLTRMPQPSYTTKQFSSYDRASTTPGDEKGWFANADAGQYLRVEEKDGRKEHVMMDINGPGAIVRIWSANPKGTLRIYLDGADQPVIESKMDQILGGSYSGLPKPIAGERSRGWNLYFPIPYAKHCKVTSDEGGFYYHVNYRTYAPGTRVETFKKADLQRLSSRIQDVVRRLETPRDAVDLDPDRKKTAFDATLKPGKTAQLVEVSGARAIVGLLTHLEAEDLGKAARSLILEITFDGEKTVEAPVGDYYGTVAGLISYASVPLGVTDTKPADLWSHWMMPFRRSASIAVRNLGRQDVRIHGAVSTVPYKWDDSSLLFHAKWRTERDVPGRPFTDWAHLEVKGEGRFVGGNLHIVNAVRDWWGEGDEKIYVDGEKFPSHFGTGTEDYYGYAWCSPDRFVHAYHNQPYCQGPRNYGHTMVHRYHVIDDIPFTKSFKFDIENWHGNGRPEAKTTRAATSYWYAKPGSTDFFKPIEAQDVALPEVPPYVAPRVQGAIEGEEMTVLEKTGNVGRQDLTNWSNDAQLWWRDGKPGDKLVLQFKSDQEGDRNVVARLTRAGDYGKVQLYINGTKVGDPIDLYTEDLGRTPGIQLGPVAIKKGANTLTVELLGKSDASSGTMFGIDYLLVR